MTSPVQKWISVAAAALFAAALIAVWPAALGGATTYVVTHGISMEPRFHSDDLAILRTAPSYAVGDVVAYHGVTVHTLVMHRIIGGTPAGFEFKGDNNSSTDPDHLPASAIAGHLWLRVPHGGKYLRWLHSPWLIGAIGLIVMTLSSEKARRGARGRRKQAGSPTPAKVRVNARLAAAAALALAIAATGVAGYAVGTSATAIATSKVTITHKPSFSYDALTRPGVTYPDGHARTGQPIYLGLLRRLDVTVGDAVSTSDGSDTGPVTAAVTLTLANQRGWSTTIVAPPAATLGASGLTVPIDVPALASRLAAVTNETGDPAGAGAGTVTVAATFTTDGSVHGRPAPTTATATFGFALDATQLRPVAVSASASDGAASAALMTTVSVPTATRRVVKLSSVSIPVGSSRVPLGILAAAAWIVAAVFGARALAPRHPTATLLSAIGARRVDVEELTLGASVIDVTSVSALVRIADRYDRLVLCRVSPAGSVFVVNDDGISYRLVVPVVGARHLRVA